jgi:hypothetical protein
MSGGGLDRSKIRREHLERSAFVYVRQSSHKQVRENQESRRRQYAFAEQARALGWNEPQVVVLDEDQGRSAASPESRPGFARLTAASQVQEDAFKAADGPLRKGQALQHRAGG